MCLAIPGQIVELYPRRDGPRDGDVSGVRRRVDLGLLDGQPVAVGDWVLIHVGFAMSKISEADAQRTDATCSRCSARTRPPLEEFDGYVSAIRGRSGGRRAMKYVDEFRDPQLITKAARRDPPAGRSGRHYRMMEVCGGHTHAIYRFGLKDLLPPNIELMHGPGCPVCVLPMGRIDDGLAMAERPDVILTAFGDMMRVPGTQGQPARTQGARAGRPHRLLAARCAAAGAARIPIGTSCSLRSASRRPRRRPR